MVEGKNNLLGVFLKLVALFGQILKAIISQQWPLHSFFISLSSSRSLVCTQV